MASLYMKQWVKTAAWLGILMLVGLSSAYASSSGNLPFNTTIDNFQKNFSAWILTACVILWAAYCAHLAFGEWTEGVKRLMNVLLFMSLALAGSTVITMIFGTGAVI